MIAGCQQVFYARLRGLRALPFCFSFGPEQRNVYERILRLDGIDVINEVSRAQLLYSERGRTIDAWIEFIGADDPAAFEFAVRRSPVHF